METLETDILIVGGGSAGSVLANRLSADGKHTVTLVEAGEDYPPGGEPASIRDPFYRAVHHPENLWPDLNVRWHAHAGGPFPYAQARVIGGGSSVNAMMAIRGLPEDYDAWAARGLAGWGWNDVAPYFRKLETDLDFTGSPHHGSDGPISIRRIAREDWPPVCQAAERALARTGHSYIDDFNAAPTSGYGRVTLNNLADRRVSAAMGYLSDDVRSRPNLRIVPNTRATRLLMEGRRVIGAEGNTRNGSIRISATLVVLSAGAIQSPTLLMRSGIGPGDALQQLGMDVSADLHGVGRNLHDHVTAGIGLLVKRDHLQDPAIRPNGNLVLRLSSRDLSPQHHDEPEHDLFLPVYNKTTWHALGERIGLVLAVLYAPHSRGAVTLASPDPAANPAVDFNLLDDDRDLHRMMTAMRFAASVAAAPELEPLLHGVFPASFSDRIRKLNISTRRNAALSSIAAFLVDRLPPARRAILDRVLANGANLDALLADDAALAEWLTVNARGFFHATGTCAMGSDDDPHAVLDARCRVRGLDGLRVVDASILPQITRASLNVQSMMIGERAADLILEDLSGRQPSP